MNKIEARTIIINAINTDPTTVIAQAILFNPRTSVVVDGAKSVPGPLEGVAAIALKAALRGDTNEATENNMIRFAELLTGEMKCLAQ